MKFNFDFDNIKKIDADAVKAFEKKYDVAIPTHLVELMRELNGSHVKNGAATRPDDVYGIHGFVDLSEIEKEVGYLDTPIETYLPIAFDPCGNYFLLELASDQIYFWDHEVEYPYNMTLLFNSLDDFIASIQVESNDKESEYVEVNVGLSGNYCEDSKLINQRSGNSETPEGYVWHHHENCKTMQLVPKDIHNSVRHTGGATIIKSKKQAYTNCGSKK